MEASADEQPSLVLLVRSAHLLGAASGDCLVVDGRYRWCWRWIDLLGCRCQSALCEHGGRGASAV